MSERLSPRSNIVEFPRPQEYLVIGNNALKAEVAPIFEPKIIDFERPRQNPLKDKVNYFDSNWKAEGLPRDWYNIDDVGFSINRQMRLLDKSQDPGSWREQTGRDLLGFGLEYLKQGTFFPFEYKIEGQHLIDERYGGRSAIDTVDPKERDGSVLESLCQIQDNLISAEEGASAIMVSPPGATGLTLDNGSEIFYKDTMVFHMQKKGDRVIGGTIRVDFDLRRAKELIRQLTGQELDASASVIDCVKAVTFVDPQDESLPKTPEALVTVLENINETRYSYKDKTWSDTRRDIRNRDALYDFDQTTQEIIEDFKDYIIQPNLSRTEIQKALAATFLRISKHLLVDVKNIPTPKYQVMGKIDIFPEYPLMNYGAIVNKVKTLPGCMGGGGSLTSVNSIIPRVGIVENSGVSEENFGLNKDEHGSLEFPCPHGDCKKINTRTKGQLLSNCQHCGKDVRC